MLNETVRRGVARVCLQSLDIWGAMFRRSDVARLSCLRTLYPPLPLLIWLRVVCQISLSISLNNSEWFDRVRERGQR